jgi:phosphohistidine phosphatase
MPRYLYLLRHAQSAEKQHGQTDRDRNLTHLGMKQALLVAQFLKEQKTLPEMIMTSVAERAKETTSLIADALNFDPDRVLHQDELYEASTRTFLDFIRLLDHNLYHVMCVGHNPTISYLGEYLTKSEIGEMVPGGLSILKFNVRTWAEVTEGGAELVLYRTPETQ